MPRYLHVNESAAAKTVDYIGGLALALLLSLVNTCPGRRTVRKGEKGGDSVQASQDFSCAV